MSKSEVLETIKNEEKKSKIIFACSMVGGVLLGGVIGFALVWLDDSASVNMWIAEFVRWFESMSVYVGMFITTASTIATIILYKQGRKLYVGWDEEDEVVLSGIEFRINTILMTVNANIIVTYMFMVVGFSYFSKFETYGLPSLSEVIIFILGVAGAMTLMMVGTSKAVNFQKEINPEKQGSAYDFNFRKKWMNSSDEAEKMLNYKAAYEAYKTTNTTCLILWMVSVFGVVTWDWGIVPGIMVSTIWLVTYLRCNVAALKLSKHVSKIQE